MLVIRWFAANVRITAYYSNLILITSFLGLSLGSLRARMRINTFYLFPPLSLLLIITATVFGEYNITRPTEAEEFWSTLMLHSKDIDLYYVLLIVIILNIVTFIPIGQLTGRLIARLPAIPGYSVNVAGSILGILCFTMISFLRLSPPVWFLISFIVALFFLLNKRFFLLFGLSCFVLGILLIVINDRGNIWSPYYRLTVSEKTMLAPNGEMRLAGYQVNVNTDLHQYILNLRDGVPLDSFLQRSKSFYDAPYMFSRLQDVLVIGSGGGNDVAAALRMEAERIVAVEIDPVIVELGRKLHPERPYQSGRVTLMVNDARTFLKRSRQKFDLVVFGFLDSQRLFSHMSTLRLDSYIYTLECFQEVKERLKPGGVCAVSFAVTKDWMFSRFVKMLSETFDAEPLVYENKGAVLFVVSPNKELEPIPVPMLNYLSPQDIAKLTIDVPISTDDWPFLYLKSRGIPTDYAKMLVTLFLLAAVFVLLFNPSKTASKDADFNDHGGLVNNLHFFFLGAAFMLLETKSITELSLIFGSTWLVNSIVVAAILVMVLLANLLVAKSGISSVKIPYLLLFISIMLNYAIPAKHLSGLGTSMKVLLAGSYVTLPLFFAGIIFIISFKKAPARDIAFGANILGAVLGGITEYLSLAIGFRVLYLVAIFYYLISYLSISKAAAQSTKGILDKIAAQLED